MNKSYISIWNDASGTWVAAPETARTRSGAGTASSCSISSGNEMASRPATPLRAAFMPIAMAIGAAMLPGMAAAQATVGNGGLELCPAGVGGLGSAWGPLSSAVGAMDCNDGSGAAFSLNNAATSNGANGFASGNITARVTGYQDGHLELVGMGGINMLNTVNMTGHKVGNMAAGDVTSGSGDAVNGGQLYQYTRYFQANSTSGDPSTDAQAMGSNSVASGPSSRALGSNSAAYGAGAIALVSNSVALGAGSVASRSDSVSVGYLTSDGRAYTRQITNVTAGAAGTDAVNLDQLNAAIASVSGGGNGVIADNAVVYDSSTSQLITLKGSSGTKITNLTAGDISSEWSTDAVNGAQLFQTNKNVANVANDVAGVSGNLANVTNVVNNLVKDGLAGSPLVVTYDSPAQDSLTLGGTSRETTVKLTNVSPGDISSASSTDAVNGGQLYQTNQNLRDLANNVGELGTGLYNKGVKYFHANSSLADSSADGTDSVAIGGAAVARANNSVALGSNSLADRSNAVSVGASGAERQIINVAQGTQDNDAVNLAQLRTAISNASIGDGPGVPNAVSYDSAAHDSLTLGDAGAAPVALKNVAAGQIVSGSTDAVNGNQLYNTANSVAAALGGGATVNPDGTVSAPGYSIGGVTYNNMGDALGALNSAAGDLVGAAKYVKVVSTSTAALATGQESVAIGGGAMATSSRTLAIGTGASASYENSTAIGVNAVTDAANTVSFGSRGGEMRLTHIANGIDPTDAVTMSQLSALQAQLANVQPTSGVKSMLGTTAVPVTNYIAVSSNVTAGSNTSASDDMNAMAIGPVASATGIDALAVGAGSIAGSSGSTAVGARAAVASNNSTAIGTGAVVAGLSDNAVSIGYNARVAARNATALGTGATATGTGSVAIGYGAFVNPSATNAMALGLNTSASAVNGVAIGYGAVADRDNAVSVGNASRQSQIINVAAGTSSNDAVNVKQLSGVASALGGGAAVNPDGTIKGPSYTVGGQTYTDVAAALEASAAESLASAVQYDAPARTRLTLGGVGASEPVTLANVANGVADNDAVNMGQLKQLGMDVDADGKVTNSFVAYDDTSLGAITLKGADGTKISNVKAGDLTATSRDAVTGGQLFETNANVADVAAAVANTAGDVTNITNTINNIVVNGDGIKYFHANSTLEDSTATGTNAVAIGAAANATAANAVALGSNSVADRANTVSVGAAGAERQIVNVANGTKGTDAVNLSQLQALGANVDGDGVVTNSFVAYDNPEKSALTLGGVGSGTPVLLSNLANGKIADSSRDAVTGAQLYNTANSIAEALGGDGTVLADGTLSKPSYVVSGRTYANVGSALDAVDGQLGQINTNFATNLKYVKVVSDSGTAQASGAESIAIGGNALATGDFSLAIGAGASAGYRNSTAIGVNSVADAENTVSVGARAAEKRITHVANGVDATDAVTMAQLNALQNQLTGVTPSSGVKSMMQSAANVTNFIAISSNVTAGANTSASEDMNAMAIGPVASATGIDALAVGAGSIAGSSGSTAVGARAAVASNNSTAIGTGAVVAALSDNSVSIGYNARVASRNATALGTGATATGTGSVAIGYGAFVNPSGTNGMALGLNTSVSAANGVAIGYGAVADRPDAVSVGSSSRQSQIINVAAGTQNTDAVNLGQLNAAISAIGNGGSANAVTYDTAAHDLLTLGGPNNQSAPAVKITNVAAGALTSTSKDAVNGAQLYNTADSVAAALGGNSTVGADGKVSKPTYTLNGQTYSDVGAALVAAANGSGSAEAVKYDTPEHDKLTLGNVGKAVTVSNVADGVANNDAVNVQQLKAMGATIDGNGKVSNAFVAYDDATKGKVTFGGAGAPAVTLTNIAVGQVAAGSKDAINGSQLYNAMNSAAAAVGGGSKLTSDGQLTKPVYTVGDNSYTGVDSAIGALDAAIKTGGNPDGVAYDTSAHDRLTLGGGNATKSVTLANVADATADDEAVNLKQLREAGLNFDSDGKVTTAFVTYDDADRRTLTFNNGGDPTRLSNVDRGVALTDAVNVGQMRDYVSGYVADHGGGNGGGGTPNAVAYDDASKNRVTLGGTDATSPVTLSNLADGKDTSDAVTYGQFSSLQNQVNNLATGDLGGGNTYINIGAPGSDGGTAAVASGSDSIALGNGAKASGAQSIAIGKDAVTAGDNSISMGAGSSAPNTNSVALGAGSTTDRDNSVSVGSADLQRQLTNVAAGTHATDAVNLGQLQQSMGNMNNRIDNVDRNAAKGIASASALNVVTPYLPGRTTLNAGIANYRGYQAVGLGVSRWNEKGSINYNLGVSSSGGNSTIVRAGIGIVLGN
jgi:autotransporter adhesin